MFSFYQKWSGFQLSNVTLELHKAAIYKKSFKDNFDEKDDKVFVAFEIDSVPERRPFLLSRDFVYARPAGSELKFQVSLLNFQTCDMENRWP